LLTCFKDIDEKSLAYAKRNVELNNLQSRIRIVRRNPADRLIGLDGLGADCIDFVMMNPPFYISEEELIASAQQKSRPPFTACTGAAVEMVVGGGEVGFVGRMIEESLQLRDRVQWYTSMLGKHSSVEALVESLRQKGIDNYAITEFIQGNKTRRWAIGWSFGAMRPNDDAARGVKSTAWKRILPHLTSADIHNTPYIEGAVKPLTDRINTVASALELVSWSWNPQKLEGIGRAKENVWSRAWRRKKKFGAESNRTQGPPSTVNDSGEDDSDGEGEEVCAFGFQIFVRVKGDITVSCIWREGHDVGIFESFCGFLRTQIRKTTA
jgi:23S rRNA (adenine1618-N6)-methyltransferase